MHSAPVLKTEHLVLRRHCVDDFANSAAMWGDSDVVRYISGTPSGRAESWSRLLRYIGHWEALGFGYWVVREKSTDSFLGEVGFADYKREMEPSIEGIPEAGWVFDTGAQGKGYAEEAVRCMLDWADGRLDSEITVCIIDPEHRASMSLAEKIGFKATVMSHYMDTKIQVMQRQRR